jgi:hypothetical protein
VGGTLHVYGRSSATVCSFRNENHTRSDSSDSEVSAAVDSDASSCVVNRRFSTFLDCREAVIHWVHNGADPLAAIKYTNFVSNTVRSGRALVYASVSPGYPVRHCIFTGNFANQTVYASDTGFIISEWVFDDTPSGLYTMSGSENVLGITTAAIAVPIVPCVLTLSPRFTAVLVFRNARRRLIMMATFVFLSK